MRLRLINSTKTDPYYNLAVEDALLKICPEDSVTLYLWQNFDTVVIGNGQNPWRECNLNTMQKDDVTLARRTTGGGAVFHDLGNLNFSFIADNRYYDEERQANMIIDSLGSLGVEAEKTGRNDILAGGRKISGNAFKHTKNKSLHHGTLLVASNLERLGHYLTPSKMKHESKGVKSVRSRVTNINDIRDEIDILDMKNSLADTFEKNYGKSQTIDIRDLGGNFLEAFTNSKKKLSSREWIYGKTVDFNMSLENKFDWGYLQIDMEVRKGNIESLVVNSDAMIETLSADIEDALLGAEVEREAAKRIAKLSKTPGIDEKYAKMFDEIAVWMTGN